MEINPRFLLAIFFTLLVNTFILAKASDKISFNISSNNIGDSILKNQQLHFINRLIASWSPCGTNLVLVANKIDGHLISTSKFSSIPAIVKSESNLLLKSPSKVFNHYSNNCFTILFTVENSNSNETNFLDLNHRQIVIPNRDYFFFIGTDRNIIRKEMNKFSTKFKYKLGLAMTNLSNNNNNKNPRKIADNDNVEFSLILDEYFDSNVHFIEFNSLNQQQQAAFKIPPVPLINFIGKTLSVSAAPMPPFIIKNPNPNEIKYKPFAGSNYDVLYFASLKYNFTLNMNYSNNKPQGFLLKNNSWTGISGEIYRNEHQIAILLAQDLDRFNALDLTGSYFGIFKIAFTTVIPELNIHPSAIIYPYDKFVWSLIFSSVILITPVFYIYLKNSQFNTIHNSQFTVSQNNHQQHKKNTSMNKWELYWKAISIPFKIATEQDVHNYELPKSLRFLTGLWMFYMIIITTGYKSNLLTFMTLPYEEELPKSFTELAFDTKYSTMYKIYYHDVGGADFKYFDKKDSLLTKNLRDRFILEKDISKCLVKSLKYRQIVCMGWNTVISQIIAKNLSIIVSSLFKPLLVIEKSSPFDASAIMALPKYSIYTESINFIAKSYYESGLVTTWRNNVTMNYKKIGKAWLMEQAKSNNNNQQSTSTTSTTTDSLYELIYSFNDQHTKPMQLKHLKLIIWAFLSFSSLSLFVFLGEIISKIKRRNARFMDQ